MSLYNTTASIKRRFSDDNEEVKEECPTYKRFNDNVISSMVQPSIPDKEDKELALIPSITYASPDYRLPISPNALWLQSPATPQQQQQYNNNAQQQSHHQEKLHFSDQIVMVEEADSTDDLTTALQTPLSILLDGHYKHSSTCEQNNWKNHGSSFADLQRRHGNNNKLK